MADLRRVYGISLSSWLSGEITSTELASFIEWLPDTSAYHAVIRKHTPATKGRAPVAEFGWGLDRHLLAALVDYTAGLAAGKKAKPVPRPEAPEAGHTLAEQIEVFFANR